MKDSEKELHNIEQHFHTLIMKRAGNQIKEHHVDLPKLTMFPAGEENGKWFPVPGMYGGFHYWFEKNDEQLELIVESWCRVVDGSGQRHRITSHQVVLVEEGFV